LQPHAIFHTQFMELANQHHIRFPIFLFVSIFILSLLITKLLLQFKAGRFLIG
jgi:hypothetical protein